MRCGADLASPTFASFFVTCKASFGRARLASFALLIVGAGCRIFMPQKVRTLCRGIGGDITATTTIIVVNDRDASGRDTIGGRGWRQLLLLIGSSGESGGGGYDGSVRRRFSLLRLLVRGILWV